MSALVEGLFPKERLLSYIRDFIVFEVANEKITKKGAKYHQFFAVRWPRRKRVETHLAGTDRRIGVIWHTTGSGKSLSMAFLVGILRRRPELENPTFVIQVDRTDLDDQLHDQFVAARSLVGDVKQADSVDDLRDLLATRGGEVIFTTIEKFRSAAPTAARSSTPCCPTRSNIIVIADEAHRSQYGFLKGFARYLAEALPNALRLGFTGTPVSLGGADTVEVFGDLHPHLRHPAVAGRPRHRPDLLRAAPGQAAPERGRHRRVAEGHHRRPRRGRGIGARAAQARWAALAAAAGAKDRVEQLAAICSHTSRSHGDARRQGDGRVHDARELRPPLRRAEGAARLP